MAIPQVALLQGLVARSPGSQQGSEVESRLEQMRQRSEMSVRLGMKRLARVQECRMTYDPPSCSSSSSGCMRRQACSCLRIDEKPISIK